MSQGPAITIGNFDGVHCGHQALIRAARVRQGHGGRVVVLAFDPHPLTLLRPQSAPAPLATLAQRLRWLAEAGADEIVRLEPTPELLALDPDTFIARLCEQWSPSAIVEGSDFRFGRGRSGSSADLHRLRDRHGYEVVVIDPVEVVLTDHAIARASSTMTRWLLARGRVADATIMLGRPFEIETTIECGARRGRKLGYPTVNLAANGCLLPSDGVYGGEAELPDGSTRIAAISVGINPTFPGARRTCEAHLLDWTGAREEYGWTIRLRFLAWLRDQIAFNSVDGLKSQLARDIERVRQLSRPLPAAALS